MNYVPQKTSILAIISFALGVLGLGLPAVICGHIARSQIRSAQGTLTGGGFALAGVILGYVGIVVAILLIALAFVVPQMVLGRAHETRAKANATQLKYALIAYQIEYQRLPTPADSPASEGDSETTSDARLMAILKGENPRRISLFYGKETDFDYNGDYVDGWGHPYKVILDGNGDGSVTWNGNTVPDSVIVVSAGPDGTHGTSDDVGTAMP